MTDIVPVSCGKKIVDEFTVQSSAVLNALLAPHNNGNKSFGGVFINKLNLVVGLATPFVLRFETTRSGGMEKSRRLRAKGHLATLRILPDGEPCFGSHEPDGTSECLAHMRALAQAVSRMRSKPRKIAAFLAEPRGCVLVGA